ncbi:protein of unknown function [Pararobbsia alpina]
MRRDVLRCLNLAQQFRCVTADAVVVDFAQLDLAFRVDHERAAQCQAFFFDQHVEVASQRSRRVADQRVLNLRDRVRRVVPSLVREMRIGRDAVDLNAELLELVVVICQVAEFRRAHEREVRRVEHNHRPLALQVRIAHRHKVAVVISGCLERFDLGIDDRHLESLLGWKCCAALHSIGNLIADEKSLKSMSPIGIRYEGPEACLAGVSRDSGRAADGDFFCDAARSGTPGPGSCRTLRKPQSCGPAPELAP